MSAQQLFMPASRYRFLFTAQDDGFGTQRGYDLSPPLGSITGGVQYFAGGRIGGFYTVEGFSGSRIFVFEVRAPIPDAVFETLTVTTISELPVFTLNRASASYFGDPTSSAWSWEVTGSLVDGSSYNVFIS